jgi:hypothetical protein
MNTITQADLRAYILRKLGSPIQNIEITTDQIDDCIEESVEKFNDEHSEGTKMGFISFEITDDTIREYILDSSIKMVTEIYREGSDFQFFPTDVEPIAFSGTGYSPFLVNYDVVSSVIFRQKYQMINAINHNPIMYDFVVPTHTLIIAAPTIGKYMLRVLKSHDVDGEFLNDRWFRSYCVALTKKQWGTNLMKYEGANLPGGATFNFSGILSAANDEIDKLETELEERLFDPLLPVIA